ncbi:MAG: tetratricopeptide repeat protein [Leptothrix sp. (in: b-proteobacteria)]
MPLRPVGHRAGVLALLLAGVLAMPGAFAQAEAGKTVNNSPLDGELFYQLLVGELQLRDGEAGVAYQVLLDAARRHHTEELFRRSVDIAIGAQAGEEALAATRSWRQTLPRSRAAAEMQTQILVALNRTTETLEPLRSLIELTPAAERTGVIAALPRLVQAHGANDNTAKTAATVVDEVLKPWRDNSATRVAALVAAGQGWLAAGDATKALDYTLQAQRIDPGSESAALLALDLMAKTPAAEAAVKTTYLQAQPQGSLVRLAYARRLTSTQRYPDALEVVQQVTSRSPEVTTAWLMQGALQIELGQPQAAQDSLLRYLALKQAPTPPAPAATSDDDSDTESDADTEDTATPLAEQEIAQAYLMLAQVAEQRQDYAGAQGWLDKLGETQNTPGLILRRASLLAHQGKLAEARALVQRLPERTPDELRSKVLGEVQVLREARQWASAYDVLEQAGTKLPDDPDLLYEQALLAEHLVRLDDMERLLRRVITLKPDQQHAYNALGYSLADRNLRLDEARQLIGKAIELAPGDPFVTDSLGWVEFRLGRRDEAARLLRSAYEKRPDTEIGAHLGEVLWSSGEHDEALRIWRAGQARDPANDVLQETLHRLGVKL